MGHSSSARDKGDGAKGTRRTPLYRLHREAGARFVNFAGWGMPVQFNSIIEEHLAVRSSVGLFDISHMGELEVAGRQAHDFLQHTLTNDLTRIGDGEAQYTLMCYEDGGIVDDLLVYRLNNEKYLLCVNAVNTQKDYQWLAERRKGEVELTDKTDDYVLIALQGPLSMAVLQPLMANDLSRLKRFNFIIDVVGDIEALIARTGYTGEDGFEIFVSSHNGARLWEELMASGDEYGIKPAGLGARDTLRLEMGYPLYSHEIGPQTNPLEAGLGLVVRLDKGDFTGSNSLRAIRETGFERRLVGLEMVEKGIARQGHNIFSDGREVGYITSGTMSPSLRVPVAMGYVPSSLAEEGSPLEIEIRGRRYSAKVVKRPFYKPPAWKI